MPPGILVCAPPYWISPPLLLASALPGDFRFPGTSQFLLPYWDFVRDFMNGSIISGFSMQGLLLPYLLGSSPPTLSVRHYRRFRILQIPEILPPLLVSPPPPLEDPTCVWYCPPLRG